MRQINLYVIYYIYVHRYKFFKYFLNKIILLLLKLKSKPQNCKKIKIKQSAI